MIDTRNVQDKYKDWATELIKAEINKNAFPYAVLMTQLQGDFNFGTVVRSANAFGAKEVFYYGVKKSYDNRGTTGTHHYTNVQLLKTIDELINIKTKYNFVALEQCKGSVPLASFVWPSNPLIILGEESCGLSEEILSLAEYKVEIPMFGSVRSLNAATAASIAMHDLINKNYL